MKKVIGIMLAFIISVSSLTCIIASANSTESVNATYSSNSKTISASGTTNAAKIIIEYYLDNVVKDIAIVTPIANKFSDKSAVLTQDGIYSVIVSEVGNGRVIGTLVTVNVTGAGPSNTRPRTSPTESSSNASTSNTIDRKHSTTSLPNNPWLAGDVNPSVDIVSNSTNISNSESTSSDSGVSSETQSQVSSDSKPTITTPSGKTTIFKGRFVDSDNKPLAYKYLELHSAVLTTMTDNNGYFSFNNVEYGKHLFFVYESPEKKKRLMQTEFSFSKSTDIKTYLSGANFIIGKNSKGVNVVFQLDKNNNISILSVEGIDDTAPTNLIIFVVIGASVLILAGVVILIIKKNKKKLIGIQPTKVGGSEND
jgi:hypothetical protein